MALFNTIVTDDYAPYLLYLIGQPEGSVPEAPWPTAFSPLRLPFGSSCSGRSPSATFLEIGLQPISRPNRRLRSVLPLHGGPCLRGWLCGCNTVWVWDAWHIPGGRPGLHSVPVYRLSALDASAFLLISFGVLAPNSLPAVSALMVISALANEKVLIVFGVMFAVRLLLRSARQRAFLFLLPVIAGCALYGAVMVAFHFHGWRISRTLGTFCHQS